MKNIMGTCGAILATTVMLAAGCVRKGADDDPGREPVTVATRAAIGSEIDGLTLNSVRIIAIETGTGRVAFNEYRDADSGGLGFVNGNHGDEEAGDFITSVMPDTYDFHAIVNEPAAMSSTLDGVVNRADLEAVKLPKADMAAEATLMCVGKVAGVAISNAWTGTLNIPVVRAATMLTIKVRKQTAETADRFSITGVRVGNIPLYSYLLPRAFDGAFQAVDMLSGNVPFTANSTTYAEVVGGYILPEYIMDDPESDTHATTLRLTADYTTAGGSTLDDVEYAMTLLGGMDGHGVANTDFNMVRGTHYTVNVTIDRLGGFDYYIEYEAAKWDKVTDDPTQVTIGDNTYSITRGWANGTTLEDGGNTARVAIGGGVVFEFTMAQPASGTWMAQLSNPADFYFDEVNGVRHGTARAGFVNRIIIRPYGLDESDVETELYINIDNGTKEVEWDLSQNGYEGPGNRYVIKQIPR